MKRFVLLFIAFSLLESTKLFAQVAPYEWKYDETVSLGVSLNFPDIKNSCYNKDPYFGFNASGCWGMFIHKKPIFNRVKFAIDLGFSADFGSLEEEKLEKALPYPSDRYSDDLYQEKIKFMQANLGLRVGPSIVYKLPKKDTFINVYSHFIPSVSALIDDNEFSFSYTPYYGAGIKVMFEEYGVGAEYIQGKGKFNNLEAKALKDNYGINIPSNKYIMGTRIIRVYIAMML